MYAVDVRHATAYGVVIYSVICVSVVCVGMYCVVVYAVGCVVVIDCYICGGAVGTAVCIGVGGGIGIAVSSVAMCGGCMLIYGGCNVYDNVECAGDDADVGMIDVIAVCRGVAVVHGVAVYVVSVDGSGYVVGVDAGGLSGVGCVGGYCVGDSNMDVCGCFYIVVQRNVRVVGVVCALVVVAVIVAQ